MVNGSIRQHTYVIALAILVVTISAGVALVVVGVVLVVVVGVTSSSREPAIGFLRLLGLVPT